MDSYDYMVTQRRRGLITIDGRFYYRAQTPTGYYWKTFDIFTQGDTDIVKQYAAGRSPCRCGSSADPRNSSRSKAASTLPEPYLRGDGAGLAAAPTVSIRDKPAASASAEEVILESGPTDFRHMRYWPRGPYAQPTRCVHADRFAIQDFKSTVADKTNSTPT